MKSTLVHPFPKLLGWARQPRDLARSSCRTDLLNLPTTLSFLRLLLLLLSHFAAAIPQLSSTTMLLLGLLLLLLPLLPLAIYFLSKAEGDFTLMTTGRTPRSAIEDKVVWITGASQGIGEALAKEYARLGAKLILSSRRKNELERVKSSLSGKNVPDGVVVLPFDVSSSIVELKEVVEKAVASFGGAGIDIMVHNAASPRPKASALEFPDDMLQTTFEINVLSPIRLTQLLLPGMLFRGRGQFVVVSSLGGKVPAPGQAVYAASKHAVNGYFHSLRAEVSQQGIKVTVVCPGPIDTTKPENVDGKNLEARLSVPKCAELIVKAASHDLKEAWISNQPILAFLYVMQYLPALGYAVINRVGPKRVESFKHGKSAYNTDLLFKKTS